MSFFCAVALSPSGETTLACVSGSVQFNCTAPLAIWTTTGFLDDDPSAFLATGQSASRSSRLDTIDDTNAEQTSVIFITNFSYGDQNAIVMCLNQFNTSQIAQTRIVVGKLLYNLAYVFGHMVLTAFGSMCRLPICL